MEARKRPTTEESKTTTRGNSGVVSRTLSAPAFGQADLSNCEREQIQLAGSIQPHGALIVVREPDLVVVQASANTADFLSLSGNVIGRKLDELGGNILNRIQPVLKDSLRTIPVAVRCTISEPPAEYDVLLHRPPDGGQSNSSAVLRRSICQRPSARP
jgi:chemotaxis family two-component system sensor kinase Cph1